VRNVEGGTKQAWDACGTSVFKRDRRVVDSDGEGRDGEGNPQEGACSWEAAGGRGSRDSEEGRSAREDEPTAQVVGDGDGGKPRRPSRKRRSQDGIRQPNVPGTSSFTRL